VSGPGLITLRECDVMKGERINRTCGKLTSRGGYYRDNLSNVDPNRKGICLNFRPSVHDISKLLLACPDLKVIKICDSYTGTLSEKTLHLLKPRGVHLTNDYGECIRANWPEKLKCGEDETSC